MLPAGFLYRRIAGLAPCALLGVAGGALALRNKWQVSSLRDVFLSAHYWRLFEHLSTPPSLVVDLGGHCGHFPVLCDLIIEERYGRSSAHYLVFEALAELIDEIHSTMGDTGLSSRCTVVHGLVGRGGGSAQLRINPSNLLETSIASNAKRGPEVPYVDLFQHIPDGQPIDVLKIDIEGSEHDLVDTYPPLFTRTRMVAMEIHEAEGRPASHVLDALDAAGLRSCLPHIRKGPNLLVLAKRESPP